MSPSQMSLILLMELPLSTGKWELSILWNFWPQLAGNNKGSSCIVYTALYIMNTVLVSYYIYLIFILSLIHIQNLYITLGGEIEFLS